jgi:hypothetical protein
VATVAIHELNRKGQSDMEQTLSSAWTFIFKYPFPIVWIGLFGYGTFQLLLHPEEVVFNGVKGGATPSDQAILLIVFGVGASLLVWLAIPLKRVRLDGKKLLVSNYLVEREIPINQALEVRQNRWLNLRPVIITFRTATPFGNRIAFIPHGFFQVMFWKEDKIVHELRRLARAK